MNTHTRLPISDRGRLPVFPAAPAPREGSTLTEVLVALLIMSIGLVSLATLFPLSTLRAAKAVQMTAATDLRFNAEAVLQLYPQLISDPDLTPNTRNVPSENPPANEPQPLYKLWVIDPLGWNAAASLPSPKDGNNVNYADFFGFDGNNSNLAWTRVQRWAFNRRTADQANAFAAASDNFIGLYEGRVTQTDIYPGGVGGNTRAVVNGIKNAGLVLDPSTGAPLPPSRIVLFSADNRTSQVRPITKVDLATDMVYWTEDVNGNNTLDNGEDYDGNGGLDNRPLATTFLPSTARIETPDQRYTWLMTMRKTESGLAEVDVVVFFKRQFLSDPADPKADERLFTVQSTGANPVGFVAGSPVITVSYTMPNKPQMRRGGFVFDAGNGRWYRISNVVAVDDTAGRAVLTIDPPAVISSPRDTNGNLVGNRAMFPRGIVEVFPLGTKP